MKWKWFWRYMRISDLISRHLGYFPKGWGYDCGWKLQISLKFVDSQIGPRVHFSWCSRVKSKWPWRYMRMSNLISRHLGFFSKGLAYDFGSKYQISLKFVYSQFEPKNNSCWCLRVKLVILTIYEDVKFDQPPSWIFFQRG